MESGRRDDRPVVLRDRGRDGLRGRRAGAVVGASRADGDASEEGEEDLDPAGSALGRLLAHDVEVAPVRLGHKPGVLAWVTENRVWLVPLWSALFVVSVVVLAEIVGHQLSPVALAVLGAFWVFATGREGIRQRARVGTTMFRRDRLREIARQADLPPYLVQDEYQLLELLIAADRRRELGGGDDA